VGEIRVSERLMGCEGAMIYRIFAKSWLVSIGLSLVYNLRVRGGEWLGGGRVWFGRRDM